MQVQAESAFRDNAMQDTVVAGVVSEQLPEVLVGIHRGGFGSAARVLDPRRGSVAGQLHRAGYRVPAELDASPHLAVLLIHAPGKAEFISNCLHQLHVDLVYRAASADGSCQRWISAPAD